MSELTRLKQDIAVSLFYKSATIDELMERDFLKTTSRYGVDRMLHQLEKDDIVYYRWDKYHTYKKIRTMSSYSEYELY